MVLIADSHAEDRERLRDLLEGMGHAVIETSNAQDALAEARKNRPDLVLSDVLIPGIDGFELCRWFQQDPGLRHVPFVFVTAAYADLEYAQFASDVGAVRVLRKPVNIQELRVALEELLTTRFVPDTTQKLRRLDNDKFHQRHASAAVSQLEAKVAELERLARRYKLLSETNQAIVRLGERESLFAAICRIAVDDGGARFAAIIRIDHEGGRPQLAVWFGESGGFATDPRASLDGFDVRGPGLTAEALRSGEPGIDNDLTADPSVDARRAAARHAGAGAVGVYPFIESGVVAGAIEIYAQEPGFFTAEMHQTLAQMATHVSFALDNYARAAERDRANQAAANALDYSRLLIAASPVAIITYKASGAAVSANEAAAQFVGGSTKQLESLNFRAIESWKTSGLLALAEECLASNRVMEKDIYIASTTFGKAGWFTARLVPFEHGSQRHLLALFSNITERVRAAQALRDKDRLLSDAQRIAHIGSWQFDRQGTLSWSDEMYEIFGVSSATFAPTRESFVSLIHPEERAAMQAWSEACAAGQRLGERQFRIIRPDGTDGVISGRCELLYDAENSPPRVIGTVQDITERRRARLARRKPTVSIAHWSRNSPWSVSS